MAVRCRNATRRRSSSVKMAAPLATYTKGEHRPVIRFLSSEGVKPIEIHRRMKVQCGYACLSVQQVYEWTRKFLNSISSVTDSPRPGQAHTVVTPEATAADEVIVKENRRVTVNETAAHLDMSHGSANHIVHGVLQFHKAFNKLQDKIIFKVFISLTLVLKGSKQTPHKHRKLSLQETRCMSMSASSKHLELRSYILPPGVFLLESFQHVSKWNNSPATVRHYITKVRVTGSPVTMDVTSRYLTTV